jgi:uncharacterized membrane protein
LILNFGPFWGLDNATNAIVTMLAGFSFIIIHGYLAWGWKNILFFLVLTWTLSFCAEALGVATGLIFGDYYYTDHLGFKLLGVPLLIQVSYVSMGYASLMMARYLLGTSSKQNGWSLFISTLVGTLLMVAWDLCLDPYESTVLGDWIWQQGGPYFGVGLHNFAGWFTTVFLFMFLYQVFAFYNPEKTPVNLKPAFDYQPLIYYTLMALNLMLIPFIGGLPETMASPANYCGSLNDLVSSLALITFYAMGTPCCIAWGRAILGAKS